MPETAGRGKVVFALSVFCQLCTQLAGNHPRQRCNQPIAPASERDLRIVKKHFALGINHGDVCDNCCHRSDIGRRDRETSVRLWQITIFKPEDLRSDHFGGWVRTAVYTRKSCRDFDGMKTTGVSVEETPFQTRPFPIRSIWLLRVNPVSHE